ncbi:MAG TPA: pantoate--beta-alanine ligase, partial [Nitrosomonas sp.]|nr:pantoate--beta-alanine ligase [Nitrosomonas sp.]
VEILDEEIIRAPDGLALSSRNRYLDDNQRIEANHLYQTLNTVKTVIQTGQSNFPLLERNALSKLETRGWSVDYIAVLNQDTLQPAHSEDKALVVAAAARIGQTRLIDNIELRKN